MSHVLVGLATLALAGCSSLAGKAGSSTESELIEPLSSPITLASDDQRDSANTELPPVSWWQAFNDSQLNGAVELALAGNYSLQAAAARLDQSLASVRGSRSDYYPQVNAEVGKSRRWDGDDSTTDAWSAGVSASYELDLWGSIRAGAAQSQFTADASEAAYRTLANTVAGEVSTYWLGLRVQAERLRLLASQKQRLETALQVIEGRKRRGQAALTDVWQQQKLVESLSVDIFAAEAQRDIYLQQLALWSGVGETSLADNEIAALAPIAQPSLTLSQVPLEALKARPDIQQAFAQLQAASAGVAVAVANRYPRLSLTASYAGSDSDLSQVFDNWVANIAGSLVLPL
ncbi:MAG: TolC family protein, partial [Pseudomonadota bacterium]|nr:TolC family protein [Pseudomonadota bacterium]